MLVNTVDLNIKVTVRQRPIVDINNLRRRVCFQLVEHGLASGSGNRRSGPGNSLSLGRKSPQQDEQRNED